jgi:hypothetical protein
VIWEFEGILELVNRSFEAKLKQQMRSEYVIHSIETLAANTGEPEFRLPCSTQRGLAKASAHRVTSIQLYPSASSKLKPEARLNDHHRQDGYQTALPDHQGGMSRCL